MTHKESMNKSASLWSDARQYYTKQRWEHIKAVLRHAKDIKGSSLTPVQRAAILYHDSARRDMGDDLHGANGAEIAVKELASRFSKEKLNTISKAIRQHNYAERLANPIPAFSSRESQLLAIADDIRESPEQTWRKTLKYNIKGTPQDKTPGQLVRHMKKHLDPYKRMPELKYYQQEYQDRFGPFKDWLEHITQEQAAQKIRSWKQTLEAR